MVVIESKEVRDIREAKEKAFEDQYKTAPASRLDFVKGIVGGISGGEEQLEALLGGNEKKISRSGKKISDAMFVTQLTNLGAGMFVGSIGSRAGARSAMGVEAGKLPWWKGVPKGGIRNRKGRFEKFTPKDLINELERQKGKKLSTKERESLEQNKQVKETVNKFNARPNYYRAMTLGDSLFKARVGLKSELSRLEGSTRLQISKFRGNVDILPDSFFKDMARINKLKGDIGELGRAIEEQVKDAKFYEKSENPVEPGGNKGIIDKDMTGELTKEAEGYKEVPTEEPVVKPKVELKIEKPKGKNSKIIPEDLARKQKILREKEEEAARDKEELEKENERPDFSDPIEEAVEEEPKPKDPTPKDPTPKDPIEEKIKENREGQEFEKIRKKPGLPSRVAPLIVTPIKNNKQTPSKNNSVPNRRRIIEDGEEMGSVEGVAGGSVGYSSSIKSTLDRANIDELLSITLKVSTDAYEPTIGREEFYDYFGQFEVPFIFYLRNRTVYIGFRGTDSISNMLTDIQTADTGQSNLLNDYEFIQNKLSTYFGDIKFHSGFIKAVIESYQFIEENLKNTINSYDKIVVTGHSLGGAIGQIFTYIYNNSNVIFENKKPISYLVTYGQPRALLDNDDYIEKYNNSVPNYIRVWNTNDPVPYFPFKKKVYIDETLGTNMMSGYTHVGKSFNLKENLSNNNINILAYELIQGSTEQLIALLQEYNLEETEQGLALLSNKKYLSLLTYCFYENLKVNEIKEDVTKGELQNLNIKVQTEMKQKVLTRDKCDIVRPFGIADLLEANPIVDDLDPIKNFELSSVSAISTLGNKIFSRAHKLFIYQEYLDRLLSKQIEERKGLFEIVEERPYLKDDIRKPQPPIKVIGIYEGEFNNNELISF